MPLLISIRQRGENRNAIFSPLLKPPFSLVREQASQRSTLRLEASLAAPMDTPSCLYRS